MGKNDVHFAMSAADAGVVRAWMNAKKGPQQMAEEMRKLGGVSDQAGRRGATSMDRFARSFRTFAGAVFGVGSAFQMAGTAVALVRAELEQIRRVSAQAQQSQVSAGERLAQLRMITMPPGADITADDVHAMASEMVSPVPIDTRIAVAAEAISAGVAAERAGERAQIGLQTVQLLGPVLQNNVAALTEFARAATFLKESFPKEDVRTIILNLRSALSAGPAGLENIEQFAANIVPAAAQLGTRGGFNLQDALALLVGVQARTMDVEGATTRTNVFQLVDDIISRTRQAGRFDLAREGMGMIDFVQSDDPVARQIRFEMLRVADRERVKIAQELGITVGEMLRRADIPGSLGDQVRARAKGKGAIIELLQAATVAEPEGGAVKARIAETREVMLTGEAAVRDFQQRLAQGANSANQMVFELSNVVRSIRETALAQPARGVRGGVLQALEQLLPVLGEGALGTRLQGIVSLIRTEGADPVESLRELRDVARRQLDVQQRRPPGRTLAERRMTAGRPFLTQEEMQALPPERRENIELTRQLLTALNQLLGNMERATAAQEQAAMAQDRAASASEQPAVVTPASPASRSPAAGVAQ